MVSEKKHIVLQTENLDVGYFRKKEKSVIAKNINFSIAKGELVGLVGTNGIGKSTLLRTLAGMQPKLSGSISINGLHFEKYNSIELATQLSVVLTEVFSSKNLTVQEMVSLGRQPYTNWIGKLTDKDKTIVTEALQATETTTLSHKKCYELSDGQLQRVAIARALAQDTPIIILDEPTTHLDLYHRAFILKMLKQLASQKNKAILFSTHEIDLAIQLSDKMLVMTEVETYFDAPCKLIEQGIFTRLFPEETIHFNEKTGSFKIIK